MCSMDLSALRYAASILVAGGVVGSGGRLKRLLARGPQTRV
jgi:hypothetical protein